jgi:hypothetical protein
MLRTFLVNAIPAISTLLAVAAMAADSPQVERLAVHEVALEAEGQHANPYVDLTATAELTPPKPSDMQRSVPLFWDGGGTWKFRVSPDQVGKWKWSVKSADAGLNGKSGSFDVVASQRCGSIRPMKEFPTHFERQDGTPLWFLGDTAWSLFTDSTAEQHDRASAERYLRNRAEQGFNVVHAMLLNEAGWGNSGGAPWLDLQQEQINPAYWREVDERVALANAQGLVVGLALAWGEKTGKEKYPWGRFPSAQARQRYASFVGSRYGAYDVYFLVSGEWHGEVRNRKSTESEVKHEFFEIGDALRAADPQQRMIGIHPMTRHGSVREFNDARWMSFGDYQQNYLELHARILESRGFAKPVVNSEYGYYLRDSNADGIVDKQNSYTADDIRNATWDIVMAGGYLVTGFGSTYMGGNRHPTPFLPDDPKNEPWIAQIGTVKGIFKELSWWKLKPHDELLACATPRGKDRSRRVETRDKQLTLNQAPATTYWCLATPGQEYLVYARGISSPLSVKLDSAPSPLQATLIDPRSGAREALGTVAGKERFEFQPPDEQDWVILLAPPQK